VLIIYKFKMAADGILKIKKMISEQQFDQYSTDFAKFLADVFLREHATISMHCASCTDALCC